MRLMKATSLMLCLFLTLLTSSCQIFSSKDARWAIDRKKYEALDPAEAKIVVSIHDQVAWLTDGEGRPVLRTEVSTGVPGHDTPLGEFKVLEKIKDKRSNRYGRYIDEATGKVVVDKSWLHKGPPPEGTVFQGIEMPYWMRLTWWGVGMHVGEFPTRTRCSFGCVRVFRDAQPMIYAKTQVGTPVKIVKESKLVEMFGRAKR